MLIGKPRFYVGVIDGALAYESKTKDSITCELFRSYKMAKRKYAHVARMRFEDVVSVTGAQSYEYLLLQRRIEQLEAIQHRATLRTKFVAWINQLWRQQQKLFPRVFRRKPRNPNA